MPSKKNITMITKSCLNGTLCADSRRCVPPVTIVFFQPPTRCCWTEPSSPSPAFALIQLGPTPPPKTNSRHFTHSPCRGFVSRVSVFGVKKEKRRVAGGNRAGAARPWRVVTLFSLWGAAGRRRQRQRRIAGWVGPERHVSLRSQLGPRLDYLTLGGTNDTHA